MAMDTQPSLKKRRSYPHKRRRLYKKSLITFIVVSIPEYHRKKYVPRINSYDKIMLTNVMRYLKPFDLVRRFMLGQLISTSTQFYVTRFVMRSKAGWKHNQYPAGEKERETKYFMLMQKQFHLGNLHLSIQCYISGFNCIGWQFHMNCNKMALYLRYCREYYLYYV